MKDGGLAFPDLGCDVDRKTGLQEYYFFGGMTLRDYFAGQALIGLTVALKDHTQEGFNMIARHAGQIADAMLEEKEKKLCPKKTD